MYTVIFADSSGKSAKVASLFTVYFENLKNKFMTLSTKTLTTVVRWPARYFDIHYMGSHCV